MPYFNDKRSRSWRKEEDGPEVIPDDKDTRNEAKEVQAAVPGPCDDAKDDEIDAAADSGDLPDYYTDDELENDDKLRD